MSFDFSSKETNLLVYSLRHWFLKNRRDLPWRLNTNPYKVWVSEVMLQQTQVNTVIPYYRRWLERFPTIEALASASVERVIKTWEGLGYYSRARNLREGAIYIVKNYQGHIPDDYSQLERIKGLGPYTIGAILSFAFKRKAPAIDGNVTRVLTRLFQITSPVEMSLTKKNIYNKCLAILPEVEPWITMEGLIELGSLICKKKPLCNICPINNWCLSKNDSHNIPFVKKRKQVTKQERNIAVIISKNKILIKKNIQGRLMADLWEFPSCEIAEKIESLFPYPLVYRKKLDPVSHRFTRFHHQLFPHQFSALQEFKFSPFQWVLLSDINSFAFSSGHKKVLQQIIG